MPDLSFARRAELQALLQELSDYWHENPELRFGQIVANFTPRNWKSDPYYVPDYRFHQLLKAANTPTDSEPS